MRWKFLLAGLAITTLSVSVQAGDVTISAPLSDDASTGISTAKSYTHAVSGGSAATVNGVSFDLLDPDNTPANFDWNPNGFNKNVVVNNNGEWVPDSGGVTGTDLIGLLGSFTYSGNGDGNPAAQTFTLSGLTPGTMYDLRTYIRVWDTEGSGRPIDMTFTNGAEVDTLAGLMEDRPSMVLGGDATDQNAYYVSYRYTAEGSEVSFDNTVAGPSPSGSFHMYALTNEVVPEPSSMVLTCLALLGLVATGRRRPRGN